MAREKPGVVTRHSDHQPAPFVLVHGAWHGGWCWRYVADQLLTQGQRVFTPTLTGLGERAHEMSRDITLETFARDVCGVVESEELAGVVLVGHSFAGSTISQVADRLQARVRHLVYLDAMILKNGETPFSSLPPDVVAARRQAAEESSGGLSLPPPQPSALGVFGEDEAAWLQRRMTPHPMSTYSGVFAINGPVGNNLPRTYIACMAPSYPALERSRARVRATPGWHWREIATGHDAMVTAPDALASLLLELGRETGA